MLTMSELEDRLVDGEGLNGNGLDALELPRGGAGLHPTASSASISSVLSTRVAVIRRQTTEDNSVEYRGQTIERGSQKGKGIAVFTSGGDSQGEQRLTIFWRFSDSHP